MLVGKTMLELIDNIHIILAKYAPERDVVSTIIERLKERNIKNASQLVGRMVPLESQGQNIVYCLADAVYAATYEDSINPKNFFTEIEINEMKDYKLEDEDVVTYPIVFEDVNQLANNQWTTILTIQEIVNLYNSNIVNYNFETQRNPKYIVRNDGDLVMKPSVNWKSVDDIYEKLIKGLFKSNYITLNVLVNGEDEVVYDEDKKAIVIRRGRIDILDGFHRSLAMIKAVATIKNLNYKTGVMITNFNVQDANDFIRQEDMRNKIDERHIKSKNDENLMNGIVTDINTNNQSDMRGKIATDTILVEKNIAYTLNDIILDALDLTFKGDVKTRRDVGNVSSYLIDFFNEIYAIKYDDFEDLSKSRKKSMTTNKNTFIFYVVLAKFLYGKKDWKIELETILNSINFDKDSSIWKSIDIYPQKTIKINKKLIKKIMAFIKNI